MKLPYTEQVYLQSVKDCYRCEENPGFKGFSFSQPSQKYNVL